MNDKQTPIEELKSSLAEFINERDWEKYHTPSSMLLAMMSEVGELADLFRFKKQEEIDFLLENDEVYRKKVEHELADIFFYVLDIAQSKKIDLSSAFIDKLNHNKAKYPVEKFKGSNKKYNEL